MPDRLRIALPTSTFLPGMGGVEVGLHNIASRLVERGHRVHVIAPYPNFVALRRANLSLSYEVLSFPWKIWGILRHAPALGFLLFDAFFERLQRRYEFDFWHCTVGYPTGVALIHYARQKRAVPHLVRCAGEDVQRCESIAYGARLRPAVDELVRRWLPKADRLVAITESVAEEYRALGVAEERIVHIPNGVTLERFERVSRESDQRTEARERVRTELGVPHDAFIYLCVGRNHPKKNLESLLRAFAKLDELQVASGTEPGKTFDAAKDQPAWLLAVGAGVTDLNSLAGHLAIAERVILRDELPLPIEAGTVPPLPSDALIDIYGAADVFVFPSRMETFGIVLVEAMAAGLPVITTNAPGCRDIVRDGADAMVVAVDNDDALARAMFRMKVEPGHRQHWRRQGLARAREFTWDSVVDAYERTYDAGLGARQA